MLYITTLHRNGGWLAEAFAADGAAQVVFEEVVGVTAGLARLRDEVFDAVLVSHEPGVLDAIEFVEGFRAGGNDEPLIILGARAAAGARRPLLRSGRRRLRLRRRNHRARPAVEVRPRDPAVQPGPREPPAVQAERQRLQQEHHEAERLLEQQRALITDLEVLRDGGDGEEPASAATMASTGCLAKSAAAPRRRISCATLPAMLVDHYREIAAGLRDHGRRQPGRGDGGARRAAGRVEHLGPANDAAPRRRCSKSWSTGWAIAAPGT